MPILHPESPDSPNKKAGKRIDQVSSKTGKTRTDIRKAMAAKDAAAPEEPKAKKLEITKDHVPEIIVESWRIDMEKSAELEKIMVPMIQQQYRVYEEKRKLSGETDILPIPDFETYPPRILISCDNDANAWYVPGDTPTFVFTRGMFLPKEYTVQERKIREGLVANMAELSIIISHEVTHHRASMKYKGHKNSKIEEGAADAFGLEVALDNGFNPEAGIHLTRKMASMAKGKSDALQELTDVHLMTNHRIMLSEAVLTNLRMKRGTFPESASTFAEGEPILKAIYGARHTSHIDSMVAAVDGYEDLPADKQLDALRALYNPKELKYWVRAKDFYKQLNKLCGSDLTPELRRSLDAFADEVIENITLEPDPVTRPWPSEHMHTALYTYIAAIVNPQKRNVPMGKLKPMAEKLRSFIKAVEDKDDARIVSLAHDIVDTAEHTEIFAHSEKLVAFVRQIGFPQFNIEETRDIRKDGKRKTIRPKVPWNHLRSLAMKNEDVLRAAYIMGLGSDQAFHLAFRKQIRAFLDIRVDKTSGARLFNEPQTEDGRGISKFFVNDEGQLSEVNEVNELHFHNVKIDYGIAREIAEAQFETAKDEESMARVAQILGTFRLLRNPYEESSRLVCLDRCEKNFTLFQKMNDMPLMNSQEAGNELIQRFRGFIRNGDAEGIKCIRTFFLGDGGGTPDIFKLSNLYPEVQAIEDDEHDFKFDDNEREGVYRMDDNKFSPLRNSYLAFAMMDKDSPFGKEEKRKILEIFLGERYGRESEQGVSQMDEKHAKIMYDQLKKMCAECDMHLLPKSSSWQKILEALENHPTKEYPHAFIAMVECACMNTKTKPTLEQMSAFLDWAPNKDNEWEEFKSKYRVHITALSMKQLPAQEPLAEAIDMWKKMDTAKLLMPAERDAMLDILIGRLTLSDDASLKLGQMEKILGTERIQSPQQRERLFKLYADFILEAYGQDDATPAYIERLEPHMSWIETKLHKIDAVTLCDEIAKRVQAQGPCCYALESRFTTASSKELENAPLGGIISETSLHLLRSSEEIRDETLDFLTKPLTPDSKKHYAEQAFDALKEDFGDKIGIPGLSRISELPKFHQERYLMQIQSIHDNFWAAPLAARAVIVNQLLRAPDEEGINDRIFNRAISIAFPHSMAHSADARRFVHAYVKALPTYMQGLALSAMMIAGEHNEESKISAGEALALFAENMGPAETKLCQVASGHPDVPEDIRADLQRLKMHADEPHRWTALRWIDTHRDEMMKSYTERKGVPEGSVSITRVGNVVGSGSFYVAVEVSLSDGTSHILALRRPYIKERAEQGFSVLRKMSENLYGEESTGSTLVGLIEDASARAEIESHAFEASVRYEKAKEMYETASVDIDGETFDFTAPNVFAVGEAFFLMAEMPGEHFADLPEGTDAEKARKRKISMAILGVELRNILRGTFDSDRHGGNEKIKGNRIGHFDFTGMSQVEWAQEGYDQLADMLVTTILESSEPRDFFDTFVKVEARMRAAGTAIDPYVREAQKAMLSLGEYVDILESQDLLKTFSAVLRSGLSGKMEGAFVKRMQSVPENPRGFAADLLGADESVSGGMTIG